MIKITDFGRKKSIIKKVLIDARVPRAELEKLISVFEVLVKGGISERDLDTVLKEIATNTTLRKRFLVNPEVVVEECCAFKVEIK